MGWEFVVGENCDMSKLSLVGRPRPLSRSLSDSFPFVRFVTWNFSWEMSWAWDWDANPSFNSVTLLTRFPSSFPSSHHKSQFPSVTYSPWSEWVETTVEFVCTPQCKNKWKQCLLIRFYSLQENLVTTKPIQPVEYYVLFTISCGPDTRLSQILTYNPEE